MTRDETGQLLTILRATYHNVRLDNAAATVDAWFMALSDAPFPVMRQAAQAWIATQQWFPTPAELRMLAIDQAGLLPPAADAWGLVMGHIRRHPLGVPFDGPAAIEQAVQAIGGWRELRLSEEQSYDRQAFAKAYETYRQRAARDLDMRTLQAIESGADVKALA